jgi:hypothetical protein
VNLHIDLISHFEVSEVHESGIKNDPMRVADFGDGLDHTVKLSFTGVFVNRQGSPASAARDLVSWERKRPVAVGRDDPGHAALA